MSNRTTQKEIITLEAKKSLGNYFFRLSFAIILFETVTGVYLYFVDQMTKMDMTYLLSHIFVGFLIWIFLPIYFIRHLRYRKLWLESSFSRLGILNIISIFMSSVTGTILAIWGVTGLKFVYWGHLVTSALAVLGLTVYLFLIIRFTLCNKSISEKKFLKRMIFAIFKNIAVAFVALWIGVLALGLGYPQIGWRKVFGNYKHPFRESNIFYPAVVKVAGNTLVKKDALENSASCGTTGCHGDIVKQWEKSYHRNSPGPLVQACMRQFQAEVSTGSYFNGIKMGMQTQHLKEQMQKNHLELLRRCTGCHAPVLTLSGEVGNKTIFGKREHDGISCIVCHVATRVPATSSDERYQISEPNRYLFANSNNSIGKFLHETLIKTKPESHKKTFLNPALKESKYCISCHRTILYDGWQASDYARKSNLVGAKQCQGCHMPQVKSDNDISAYVKGTVSDHSFLASGYYRAKLEGLNDFMADTENFMKDKKIAISIIAPKTLITGRDIHFVVRIANVGVGHQFPGGPDGLAEAWPEITIKDLNGNIYYSYGILDKDKNIDYKTVSVFTSHNFDKEGKRMDIGRHLPWRVGMKKLFAIRAKHYVELPFKLKFPKKFADEKLRIMAKLNFREPNQHFADWALGKGKFIVPVITMSDDQAEIKVTSDPLEFDNDFRSYKNELLSPTQTNNCKKNPDGPIVYDDPAGLARTMLRQVNILADTGLRDDAIALIEEITKTHPHTLGNERFVITSINKKFYNSNIEQIQNIFQQWKKNSKLKGVEKVYPGYFE